MRMLIVPRTRVNEWMVGWACHRWDDLISSIQPTGTYLLEVLSPKNYFSQVTNQPPCALSPHIIHRPNSPTHPHTHTHTQIKISIRPDAPDEAGKILCLEYKYPGPSTTHPPTPSTTNPPTHPYYRRPESQGLLPLAHQGTQRVHLL